jgi:chloramphenicol 3-O-phosphotransferase
LKIDFAMLSTDPTVVKLNVGIRAAANDQRQLLQDAVPDFSGLMVDFENDFHPQEIAVELANLRGGRVGGTQLGWE